jgi:hypothetical protein
MAEKPFLLDPWYETLLESGGFRQRFREKLIGRSSEPWVLYLFANIPTVLCVALGLTLERKILWAGVLYGGIIALMFGIGGLAVGAESARRKRLCRWADEGEVLTGWLIQCTRVRQGPPAPDAAGSYYVEIKFAVIAPSGKELQGTASSSRDDLLLHDPLPPPGTPVLVLLLDETLFAML